MKRLTLAILMALMTLPALAGAYTVNTTAAQDAKLARAVKRANRVVCERYGLTAGCTQAQARDAFCQKATGAKSPCTGSTSIDIYPDVQAFLSAETTRLIRDMWGPQGETDAQATVLGAAGKATQAQKDQACTALGLAAGCLP